MLDGLLGRSAFSSKCKSLIKPTRTRIEALRRRAEAKQRFLKEDLAKLLANGLDVNAYGRTEEFISGLNLLSCYTFIDQSCEYIYKHLSIMQKLGGQCPEDCRETVASLMFGAARFYDLPELRDLRDVFQNRYGNGFECFVNQVFVDKLASKPPVMEKRIKLLHDIAAEFSIHWDSNGFKQRMDKSPSTLAKNQTKKLGPLSVTDDKYKLPNGNNLFRKNDYCSKEKERIEHGHHGGTLHNNGNGNGNVEVFVGRENKHHKERIDHHHHDGNANVTRKEVFVVREEKHSGKEDNDGYFSNAKKVFAHENHDRKERHGYKQESFSSSSSRAESIKTTRDNNDGHLFRASQDMISSNDRTDNEKTMYNRKSQGISNENVEDDVKKVHEEEASRFKSRYNNYRPPPYVKSSIPPAPYSKPQNSERMKKEADNDIIPLPKPRSIRRKHRSKSSSSHDEDVGTSEDAAARIVKRISSSRRKERKGLQVLFDDQHYHHHKDKDQEEKMMDKLLLHYSSKKPSSASAYDDMAKLREKKSNDEVEMIVPPMRSISLPHEPSGELEPEKKVYARANSFHPDNQAKHVHPKLPDYDDLAARFAAMRGR